MSKTPKSKEKKSNTLFNYFNKTPIEKTNNDKVAEVNPKKGNSEKSARKLNFPPELKFKAGDLVWAKMEGHPWWPALVCNHPKEEKIWRKKGGLLFHVQFVESTPSRGWIKEKSMGLFKGSGGGGCDRGGAYYSSSSAWKDAIKEADDMLALSVVSRLKKVVVMESTDEEEEEDQEKMAIDDDDEDDDSDEKENKKPRGEERKRRRIIESDEEESPNSSLDESFKPGNNDSSSDDEEEDNEDESVDNDVSSDSCSPKGLKRRRNERTHKSLKKLKKEREAKKGKKNEEEEEEEDKEAGDDEKASEEAKDADVEMVSLSVKKRLSSFSALSQSSSQESSTPSTPTNTSKAPQGFKTPFQPPKTLSTPTQPPKTPSTPTQPPKTPSTPTQPSKTPSTPTQPTPSNTLPTENVTFQHTTFKFIQPNNIRDNQGRPPSHPDYDPRTLRIPADFLAKQTPAMKQWWVLKSKYFDTILFFKMGKFYELFHMDAVVGVSELNILYMKGDYAHCGFPEISYGRFSELLVAKGYKVGRVEQTETPDQMQERCKLGKLPSKEKVVRREVCSVQSRGTQRSSFLDGECGGSGSNNFLLAISELDKGSTSTFGVCFVDVMIGTFHVGEFEDDRHASRLRTLVSHYTPVQVLHQKGRVSDKCRLMFDGCLSQVLKEPLKAETEFWEADKTVKYLGDVFTGGEEASSGDVNRGWPHVLKSLVDFDPLPTPKSHAKQALSALGAVIWYLKHCLMDQELLSIRSFSLYQPLDATEVSTDDSAPSDSISSQTSPFQASSRMVLDGVTLVNLDVLLNSSSGASEGSLLRRMDSCKTPFGKRLFKQWLCAPLSSTSSINDRLNAIDDLVTCSDVITHVTSLLSKLPDLERMLNKVHALGFSRSNKDHPDSRAVFFEDGVYSKRKIEDFIGTLEGFRTLVSIVNKFSDVKGNFKSRVLNACISVEGGQNNGQFPNIVDKLDFFDRSFDRQKARTEGVIKPIKGVNKEYDEALSELKEVEAELDEYLQDLKRKLSCKSLQYIGSGRNRYQLEMPEGVANRVSNSFELTGQRKGYKRYQDDNIKSMFSRLVAAEDRRDASQRDTMRCIFQQFTEHFKVWSQAVQCVSVLDCLLCLYNYSTNNNTCRPEFVEQDEPFLEIRSGRHACVDNTAAGTDFIPNDTVLGLLDESTGTLHPRCMLLTGPNMGGKSTLMRQNGLICIIAHLGCYVPAASCRLTPIERIFTRLGASDHIMAGESTFYVELSETSCILQHASKHSLVLLDELGRGTATYDGNAIASAVLEELVDNIGCRTIFSTHYHSIVDRFATNPHIFLAHMACMVESEEDDDPCQETITFLFKLAPGNCPKSHGFNAAKLAGIPTKVIKAAHVKAKEFEESVKDIELFRFLWNLKQEDISLLTSLPPQQWHSLLPAAG